MTTMPISAARNHFPALADQAAHEGERIIIERRGKKLCAIVSVSDLELLEALEDRYWAKEGEKALAEFEKSGEKAIPLEQVKKRLGL